MELIRRVGLLLGVTVVLVFQTVRAELVDIGNSEFARLLAENTLVVDIRRVDEWQQTGIVAKSRQLTFFDKTGRYDAQKWLQDLDSIANRETAIILICRSGSRSRVVSHWLGSKVGFNTVYNVSSGIAGWIASGGEVTPSLIR